MVHHGAGLRRLANTQGTGAEADGVLAALHALELNVAAFGPADGALLVYADRLTQDPSSIREADVGALRAAGFGDEAIHDACAIVAYFAFVNRIANGLGVELESP